VRKPDAAIFQRTLAEAADAMVRHLGLLPAVVERLD